MRDREIEIDIKIDRLRLTSLPPRDVLSVSKKLAKEREEMCRDLSRLHESMIELHDKMIMQIQVLSQENNTLKNNGVKDNNR